MTEDFLHYIWRYSLYHPSSMITGRGEKIEVLKTGEQNNNSGPDFFNAMIRTGNTVLAGNVEIHLNASDWYRHGHHNDKAYDSVILQVVRTRDTEVKRTNGTVIPTVEVKFDSTLTENYRLLLNNECWIPCQDYLPRVNAGLITRWLSALSGYRLDERVMIIRNIFHHNKNNWEESFYQILARNFGFRLNGSAFEMLARSLPYHHLLRHRDDIFHMESMLFGQAGMLATGNGDDYFKALKKEFQFLQCKYDLKPVGEHLWRYLRLRPANFPTIRIAQFASLIHKTPGLFAEIIDARSLEKIYGYFDIEASEYWDTHYVFGKTSARAVKSIGVFAIRSIIINTVVPVIYFYGKQRQNELLRRRAVDFLLELPPENNSIITKWGVLGVRAENAFQSQALLQLKNEYCSYRRCLECRIGSHLINM